MQQEDVFQYPAHIRGDYDHVNRKANTSLSRRTREEI